jgi:preprotein translocase subunit SecG
MQTGSPRVAHPRGDRDRGARAGAARQGRRHGRAFGSGSAGSLFGSAGASNFLSRATGILAAVFFATSLGLTYFSTVPAKSGGVTSGIEAAKPGAPCEARRDGCEGGGPEPRARTEPAAPAKAPEIPK